MRVFARFAAAASCAMTLVAPGAAAAATSQRAPAGPVALSPRWIKISSDAGFGGAAAGLLRTADGRLHVLWPADTSSGDHSLHYSTVSATGQLQASGVIFSKWTSIDQYPSLVPDGSGMRAIFDGANGQSGSPYNIGSFYSATAAAAGTAWTLAPGSLSHDNPPLTDNTATTTPAGTPVTAWSEVGAVAYHTGIDPHVPATTPDVKISVGPNGGVLNPTLVTSPAGVWGGWFNSSGTATMGYWVDKITTGAPGMHKAPGSGGTGLNNSQPLQPVALAARAGGGIYLAYCVPTKTLTCGHVALWQDGAARAMQVPGSASSQDGRVALAAAPGGHLWVLWFDFHANVIHAVETNAAATGFGTKLTISPPAQLNAFNGLQANASTGPLSIVALATQSGTGSSPANFFTQTGT